MDQDEWEALCDGCGKCCLIKLQDEDTEDVVYTNIACRQLDLGRCRCSNYAQRASLVPDCIVLTAERLEDFAILPPSCAYRRLSQGLGLPDWHPLVTGDPRSVELAGHSALGRIRALESEVDDYEQFVVDWPLRDIHET